MTVEQNKMHSPLILLCNVSTQICVRVLLSVYRILFLAKNKSQIRKHGQMSEFH